MERSSKSTNSLAIHECVKFHRTYQNYKKSTKSCEILEGAEFPKRAKSMKITNTHRDPWPHGSLRTDQNQWSHDNNVYRNTYNTKHIYVFIDIRYVCIHVRRRTCGRLGATHDCIHTYVLALRNLKVVLPLRIATLSSCEISKSTKSLEIHEFAKSIKLHWTTKVN